MILLAALLWCSGALAIREEAKVGVAVSRCCPEGHVLHSREWLCVRAATGAAAVAAGGAGGGGAEGAPAGAHRSGADSGSGAFGNRDSGYGRENASEVRRENEDDGRGGWNVGLGGDDGDAEDVPGGENRNKGYDTLENGNRSYSRWTGGEVGLEDGLAGRNGWNVSLGHDGENESDAEDVPGAASRNGDDNGYGGFENGNRSHSTGNTSEIDRESRDYLAGRVRRDVSLGPEGENESGAIGDEEDNGYDAFGNGNRSYSRGNGGEVSLEDDPTGRIGWNVSLGTNGENDSDSEGGASRNKGYDAFDNGNGRYNRRNGGEIRHENEDDLVGIGGGYASVGTGEVRGNYASQELQKEGSSVNVVRYGSLANLNCTRRNGLRVRADQTHRYALLEDGTLVLKSPTTGGGVSELAFQPGAYCEDKTDRFDEKVFLLCPCRRLHCASKCCPEGQGIVCDESEEKCACEDIPGTAWEPFEDGAPAGIAYEILSGNSPKCPASQASLFYYAPYPHHNSRYWPGYPRGRLYAEDQVCGDRQYDNSVPHHYILKRCVDADYFDYLLALSVVFWPQIPAALLLLVTLVVIAVTPQPVNSAFGWMHNLALTCHTLSLFVFNVSRVPLMSLHDVIFCAKYSFVIHFFLVASSLWLNVMCINIARGFRLTRGAIASRKSRLKMLVGYSMYAWGCSAALTGFTAFMLFSPHVPSTMLRPSLAEVRACTWEYFDGPGKISTLAYYYGPMGALLIVNIALCIFTICRIRLLRRNTSIIRRQETGEQNDAVGKRAASYVKLMLLMGVVEVTLELCFWATSTNYKYENYLTVILNILDLARAVSIFALRCCNRRVLASLHAASRPMARRLAFWREQKRMKIDAAKTSSSTLYVIPLRWTNSGNVNESAVDCTGSLSSATHQTSSLK